jgi:trans-aconitate methyltransferase
VGQAADGYLTEREDRFGAMFDVLEALLGREFLAIDLACGPGSLSQRLLVRFPKAQCSAVDLDPVLLAVVQGALGTMDGRLRWVEVDIKEADWLEHLGLEEVDAVLSTTALHWLPVERLIFLYRQLGQLIRPGGVFLNGDHMSFTSDMPRFTVVAVALKEKRRKQSFEELGIEKWEDWWEALRQEPRLSTLFEERDCRFSWRDEAWVDPSCELQEAALKEAGFAEVGTISQNFDNRVLMAVR